MQQEEQVNSQINENINANYFIRVANADKESNEKTKNKLTAIYKTVLKKISLEIVYDFFLVAGIMNIANVLIYWLGGYFVFNDVMTFGSLTALSLYFSRLWSPIEFFMEFPKKIKEKEISLVRIKDLLYSREVRVIDPKPLQTCFEKVDIKNLTFAFEKRILFDNFSLTINKGDKIGIYGANGSGKTTLVNLLIKLFTDYNGDIYYNDTSYHQIDTCELREKIILIPQELYVFNSKNISGGEKKTQQILEGVNRNGELYLFDEPLVYIDKKKRKEFLQFMEKEFIEKTFLIISHDKEIFNLCNKVYQFQNKKLVSMEHNTK